MRNRYKNLFYLCCLFLALFSIKGVSAQLSESFESGIPSDWTIEGTPTWTSGTYAYEGSKNVQLYTYGYYTDPRLITPKLVLDATSSISFYIAKGTPVTGIQVQYSSDMVSWTDIGAACSPVSAYSWTQYTIDLSSLSGNYYIAFKGTAAGYASNYLYFDSVEGPDIYVNPNPVIELSQSEYNFGSVAENTSNTYDLTISNRGGSDLTFSGVAVNSPYTCPTPSTIASGSSEVVTITFNPTGSGVFNETLTFNGNASNTEYTVDLSGSAYSANSVLETFDTEIPDTWSTANENADSYFFKSPGQYGVGGTTAYAAAMGCSNDYLITPKLSVVDGNNLLSFKAGVESESYKYSFRVKVSTTDNQVASFSNVEHDESNFENTSWTAFTVDLSAYNDQDIYVAFDVYVAGATNYSFGFDDIRTPAYFVSADPEIAITPASYDFGSVGKDVSATGTITLSNPGGADLTVSSVSVASPFSATWSGTIAAGGTQDVTVTLNTATAGTFTETLTVISDASAGTNTIDLTAEVVAPLTYPLTEGFNGAVPGYWTPGSWYVVSSGVYEGTHSITTYSSSDVMLSPWIDLTGTAPRMVLMWKNPAAKKIQIEITEDGSAYTELFSAAPATSDWEELVVDLATYVNKTVQIRFTSDANQSYSSTYIDDLKIEETPTDPVYEFNRTEFAFGTVLLLESGTLSASISNSGVSTVDIDAISITGTDASEFSLSTIALPGNLNNASSLDFDVTFTPASEGAKTATLTIEEADGTIHDYDITATGFDAEIKTLPFTETFDAVTTPNLPAGWASKIKTGSASAIVETSSSNANSPANSVKMYGAYSVDSLALILPVSSIDIATTILDFSLYSTSTGDMEVGYMTDKDDLNTFTNVSTFSYSGYSRKACEVKLSDVVLSGNYYLAILNPVKSNTIYIDDINWIADEQAPIATFDPADTDIDVNPFASLSISFDEPIFKNGGAELTNSDLETIFNLKETDISGVAVAFSGIVDGNVIVITPDNRLGFTSNYYLSINADEIQDAAGNLNVLSEATFTTMATPTSVSVPFAESFEGVDFVPTDWTENRTKWSKYDGTDISYPEGVASAYYSAGAYDGEDSAEMVSPIIDISSLIDPNLLFDYALTNVLFTAYISYDLGNTYEELLSENIDGDWKSTNIKLATGKEYAVLKFKGYNIKWPLSAAKIFVDNIILQETPADPIFTINYTEYDFGTVLLTENDAIQVDVTNTGGQVITITDVKLEGASATDFTLGTLSLPFEVTTNTLSIELSFVPLTGGSKEAALVIEEEDGTLHTFALTGNAFDSEIKTLPFTQNFDATTLGELPAGWTALINTTSTSAYVEVADNFQAHSAPNELRLYGGKAEGTVMAVLPFTNMDFSAARMKLSGRGSTGCKLIVGSLTDKTDEATFVAFDTLLIDENLHKPFEVDLSKITAMGTYYIALKHGTPNSFFTIYIDDIRITDNKTPEITSTPVLDGHTGDTYSYAITATDADGDAMSFSTSYKPDWATLTDNGNGTALLSGIPTETGNKSVTIVASDGEDESKQSYTLTVTNSKPSFTSAPLTTSFVNEAYFYMVSATDADGDAITLTAEIKPDWLTLTNNADGTAELAGTPTELGANEVTLRATDGFDIKDQMFTIDVKERNKIPVFTSVPTAEMFAGDAYVYNITATDENTADDLTITAKNKPEWLTFTDNGDGTATLVGTTNVVSVYYATLEVTDGKDLTEQNIQITVKNTAPEFLSLAITKVTSGDVYLYNITADDSQSDPITIADSVMPEWLTLTDKGDGTAILTGTAGVVGFYDVTLEAFDADTVKQHFVIEVTAIPNTDPVFDTEPVTEVVQGDMYTYAIEATDVDGNALVFAATQKPDWLTLVDNGDTTAVLSGIPDVFGDFNITLVVNDGFVSVNQGFVLKVTERPNVKPVFESEPITEGLEDALYTYTIKAIDTDDGDVLVFKAVTIPSWLTLVDNKDKTAELSGTPAVFGKFDIVLEVTDGKETATQSYELDVIEVPNVKPVFESEPITEGLEDALYTYTIKAIDTDDGDVLVFKAVTIPSWLTLVDNKDKTAVLSGTPTVFGKFDIVLEVTDGKETATQSYELNVIEVPNVKPEFTSIAVTEVLLNEVYTYDIVATDADAKEALTITATTLPTWLTFTDNGDRTAKLTGTATTEGNFDVVLKVSDGLLDTVQTFSIAVNVNRPEFTSTPGENAKVGQEYIYAFEATDADDADVVVLGVKDAPEWMNVGGAKTSGIISGTPILAGNFVITLFATDSKDTTYQSFTLKVAEKDNSVPEFDSKPVVSTFADELYLYRMKAIDADSDAVISFIADTLPTWMNFADYEDGTAAISGTPTEVGTYRIVISATDGKDTVSQGFDLEVNAAQTSKPEFTSTPVTTVMAYVAYAYDVIAADADVNDVLTVFAKEVPEWLSLTDLGYGLATVEGMTTVAGDYSVSLAVSDGMDTVYQDFTIAVTALVNNAPEFDSDPVVNGKVGVAYSYAIKVSDKDGDDLTVLAENLPSGLTFVDNGNSTAEISGICNTAGTYDIKIRVSDFAETDSQEFVLDILPTTINSVDAMGIKVYPNPANAKVFVELNYPANISIINITGLTLWEQKTTRLLNEIDVEDFNSGYYLIRVESQNGIEVRKLYITH